jgi:hypothetical protein
MERTKEPPFPYKVVVYRMLKKGRGVKGTTLAETKCVSYTDALEKKAMMEAEHGISGVVEIVVNKEGQ